MSDATAVGKSVAKAADAAAVRAAIDVPPSIRVRELGPNIKHPDFGAVGNGSTDDTNAFKAYRDAVEVSGSSYLRSAPLVVPAGHYKITDTIVFTNDSAKIEGAGGWASPVSSSGVQPDGARGTIFAWDGPSGIPMFKVQGGRAHNFRDFIAMGHSSPSKKPSAIFEMVTMSSGATFQPGLAHWDHVVIGKLSGLGFPTFDRVADRGIYWNSTAINAQNDSSWITNSRVDSCDVGWETTGTQSVLMHIAECHFQNCGTAVKSVSDHTVTNTYISNSTVTDFDLSAGARVTLKYLASENAYMFAKVAGSGTTLTVEGGYWQMSDLARTTEGDRKIIVATDDAYQVLRIKDFNFTAASGYDATLRPIISFKPATNSLSAQKFVDLDNVRWYVGSPNHGFREDMLDLAVPAGSSATVTLQGSIQGDLSGASSSNQGPRRSFFMALKGGQAVDFNRDDRVHNADRIYPGRYRVPRGSTSTTRTLTQDSEFCVPIRVCPGQVVDRVALNITTAAASSSVRVGVRQDNNGQPSASVTELGTMDSTSTGTKEITGLSVVATGPRLWLSFVAQGAATVACTAINGQVDGVDANSSAATTTVYAANTQSGVTGAFPSTAPSSTVGTAPMAAVRGA